jgi:hypothetical protein
MSALLPACQDSAIKTRSDDHTTASAESEWFSNGVDLESLFF